MTSMSAASDSAPSRTKVELWNEVKMLSTFHSSLWQIIADVAAAFTRTLTTLYSITLLCLLTTIQLTVLARSKYVNSVLDVEREERLQEQLESELSLPNLLLNHSTKMVQDLLSVDLSMLEDEAEKGELEGDMMTEEVERKFLTLSWWILHVGWKDVGERVRRGVEEVFEGFVWVVFVIGYGYMLILLQRLSQNPTCCDWSSSSNQRRAEARGTWGYIWRAWAKNQVNHITNHVLAILITP